MKILLCSPTFRRLTHGPSVFANILLQINDLYPEHELRILTENIEKEIPRVYRVKINYPRQVWALGKFLRMWTYHRAAVQIRRKFKFDVIIYNDAILGLWSAIRMPRNIKTVGLINDDAYLFATRKWAIFSKIGLINFIHRPFECLAVHLLDVVITNSNYLAECIQRIYKCAPSKVKRLYKSIVLAKHTCNPDRRIDPQKTIEVLFVKTDYSIGGLKGLVAALEYLHGYSFRLIVMGPYFEKEQHIRSFFSPSNRHVKLDFKGPCSRETVFGGMQRYHLLCIPSRTEGLGIANIEGLAAGIPVVSTRVGGIPEVMDNGANGWLAVPGDAKDLAAKIEDCLLSPGKRLEKSRRGRKYVEEKFNHNLMLENFLRILSDITPPSYKKCP